jgi:single-strand DNA-binding protein
MKHQMQPHKNEVHLAGVLAREPELRYTTSGKAVANFTVATTYEKRTEYHRCTAWEEQAKRVAGKFKKDSYIRLAGRLQTRSWDDKQTSQKRYITEVIVWNVSDGTTEKNAHGVEVGDHDLPF